jgi:hypothetical protein
MKQKRVVQIGQYVADKCGFSYYTPLVVLEVSTFQIKFCC